MRTTLVLLLFLGGAIQAQPPGSDPIFGMTLDNKLVHFEQASASVIKLCESQKALKTKAFWLFAHATVDGTDYFIVSNRITDVTGVAYVMRGNECMDWLPDRVLDGEASISGTNDALPKWAPLTDPVIRALADDALRRYTQAYGGKKVFLDAVRKGGLASQEMPKLVREQFEAFSRQP
jgi:hypothetical protein